MFNDVDKSRFKANVTVSDQENILFKATAEVELLIDRVLDSILKKKIYLLINN
jgi:hypothetical protein